MKQGGFLQMRIVLKRHYNFVLHSAGEFAVVRFKFCFRQSFNVSLNCVFSSMKFSVFESVVV